MKIQNSAPPQPTWLLVLIVSTSIFATTIITPSLPGITAIFAVTAQEAQMVITGFLAATAVGQLFLDQFLIDLADAYLC